MILFAGGIGVVEFMETKNADFQELEIQGAIIQQAQNFSLAKYAYQND